jgi:putative endonuclease
MRTERKKLGDEGEGLAAAHLASKGYRVLARQAGIPRVGEIDLVAYDPHGGEIVFVEVKTRRDLKYGPPEEAVTRRKLERLMRVAELWRARHGLHDRPWRLDVVAIELVSERPIIRHLQGLSL